MGEPHLYGQYGYGYEDMARQIMLQAKASGHKIVAAMWGVQHLKLCGGPYVRYGDSPVIMAVAVDRG